MLCYHTEVVKANSNKSLDISARWYKTVRTSSGMELITFKTHSTHFLSFYVSTKLQLFMMMSITQFLFFHQVSKATPCNLTLGWLQLWDAILQEEFSQFLAACTLHQNRWQKQQYGTAMVQNAICHWDISPATQLQPLLMFRVPFKMLLLPLAVTVDAKATPLA